VALLNGQTGDLYLTDRLRAYAIALQALRKRDRDSLTPEDVYLQRALTEALEGRGNVQV
jgi:hypothetical protein